MITGEALHTLPYPFNMIRKILFLGDMNLIILKEKLILDIPYSDDNIRLDDPIFCTGLELMGRWAKDMELKHPDYEINDAQLVFCPSKRRGEKAQLIASLILRKKESFVEI